MRDWESFQLTGAPDRPASRPRGTSRRLLQTSVLVFPVVHGVVQEGLLLRRHVLRLILVVEADHLRLRGRVGGSRLGAVANAVAKVDHET